MCMIVLDRFGDVVDRNFMQPRDTPVVAYKVFRRDLMFNFRRILTPIYRKSSLSCRFFLHYGFDEVGANKDDEGTFRVFVEVRGQEGSMCLNLPSGFFSFKLEKDAEAYRFSHPNYRELTVRKVLLLDVISEYNTTDGKAYMSKIFYIF